MKWYIVLATLLVSFSANSAVITSSESAGSPLTTGSTYNIIGLSGVPANTSFVHSIYFSTDELAASSSIAAIGLELSGVSGFVGNLTLSLYEGIFDHTAPNNDTTGFMALDSSNGNHLNNIAVQPNQTYSFIIEGLTSPTTQFNITSGAVAVSDVAPVPVPAAAWLFGSALMGLAMLKRKKS